MIVNGLVCFSDTVGPAPSSHFRSMPPQSSLTHPNSCHRKSPRSKSSSSTPVSRTFFLKDLFCLCLLSLVYFLIISFLVLLNAFLYALLVVLYLVLIVVWLFVLVIAPIVVLSLVHVNTPLTRPLDLFLDSLVPCRSARCNTRLDYF